MRNLGPHLYKPMSGLATRKYLPESRPVRTLPGRRPVDLDDIKLAASVIGGKRKTAILYCLAERPTRFAAPRRAVGEVSEKVLSQQLRELVTDGIVDRPPYPSVPPQVEYTLSENGRTLCEVVEEISTWGARHRKWLAERAKEDSEGK